ncbi:MAG: UDP-N-acetylmuramoyl-L-alanine--D-glutamate ligase [Ignavibacteria bacterium]|jgi:UDP-N-acetylmuramoylalanine--D-glutamate ligase
MNLENKNIAIIGAVRSGIGAAKLAVRVGAVPFVSDFSSSDKLKDNLKILDELSIEYETGGHSERVLDCDLIVTSPGVPSDSEILEKAAEKNIKVVSELEFASWFCKGKIIAITGTNGKTTTTKLAEHVLKIAGLKAYSAGNIGYAFSEIAQDIKENEYVVLEVSSFQLDFIDKFKPMISVILNITPDHLDRYENKIQQYIESKLRIYENQTGEDFLIINGADNYLKENVKNYKSNKITFSLNDEGTDAHIKGNSFIYGKEDVTGIDALNIKGEHNQLNALSVIAIAKIIGINNAKIKEAFQTFQAVEHRLEFVREFNGIKYYNDSKATNVDSVWYALRSFTEPLILILGGKDKGNDYNQIKSLVKEKVKLIYAIGSSSQKVYEFFKETVSVKIKEKLEECVASSTEDAEKGDVVLLSPACASFDMFDSYEHRGKVFKEAVLKL